MFYQMNMKGSNKKYLMHDKIEYFKYGV